MVKKHGKDTFRHTKKNILHKKRVNSKKRGLRGGDFIDTTPVIDESGLHGIVGLNTPPLARKILLTTKVCDKWFKNIKTSQKIDEAFDENGSLKLTDAGIKDYDICSRKLDDRTIEQYKILMKQAIEQGEKETKKETQNLKKFKTELQTDTSVTLTLDECKAEKRYLQIQELSSNHQNPVSKFFKYNIFSPAATTKPPNGGTSTPSGRLVGTFTQLPVSLLLRLARQETPFSFASFYTDERKLYFTDYIECLKNVKDKFGPSVDTRRMNTQSHTFVQSSILRQFGKTPTCKIVLVKGNVGSQIQDPANDGAIFVIASQFNAAELMYPEQAEIITLNDYKQDFTAGPTAQLSCHPVVAKFILDHAARKLPNDNDFTSDFLVINAIDDVILELSTPNITSLTLNNGYLLVPAYLQSGEDLDLTGSENPSPNTTAIFDSFSQRLKVLQSTDVPASGLTPPKEYTKFNSESTSKVSLIYASAVPLNYRHDINSEKSMLQYCVAGFDLVAQYFGSMVSAYHKSIKQQQSQTKVKLFLTPLGGGAFKNPREMIASSVLLAYYQAQELFTDFDANVQVIFLVWDGSPGECSDFSEFFNSSDVEPAKAQEENLEGTSGAADASGTDASGTADASGAADAGEKQESHDLKFNSNSNVAGLSYQASDEVPPVPLECNALKTKLTTIYTILNSMILMVNQSNAELQNKLRRNLQNAQASTKTHQNANRYDVEPVIQKVREVFDLCIANLLRNIKILNEARIPEICKEISELCTFLQFKILDIELVTGSNTEKQIGFFIGIEKHNSSGFFSSDCESLKLFDDFLNSLIDEINKKNIVIDGYGYGVPQKRLFLVLLKVGDKYTSSMSRCDIPSIRLSPDIARNFLNSGLPKKVYDSLPYNFSDIRRAALLAGGSKTRRRHPRHRKPVRKTRRGRKSKSKTHIRRSARKNKKYTQKH
jgi:hypothetical protein